MLKKMFKHDMRSMWRTAMPLLTASGVISVLCCGILYFTLSYMEQGSETDLIAVGMLVGSFYVMGIMAIAALQVVITVFTLVRYYKSLFTDEGYLTMVLPMESTSLINEKLLFTLTWSAISGVAMIIELLIAVFLPIVLYDGELVAQVMQFFNEFSGLFIDHGYTKAVAVLQIIDMVFSFIESNILTIAAITVGAMVMKKKRLLGAFLFYFGVTFVRENVVTVFEAIIDLILVAGTNVSLGAILASVFGILISAGIIIASYLTIRHIFTKKFNIE